MKKASAILKTYQAANVLVDIEDEYGTVRYSKAEFARLLGRIIITDRFIAKLSTILLWEGYCIAPELSEDKGSFVSFVVFKHEIAVTRCTSRTYSARGRMIAKNSVDKMIRVYANPILKKESSN